VARRFSDHQQQYPRRRASVRRGFIFILQIQNSRTDIFNSVLIQLIGQLKHSIITTGRGRVFGTIESVLEAKGVGGHG